MAAQAGGRTRLLEEEQAVALAKHFYDTKGPFVGTFEMALPVLAAHRNRGGHYAYRAEWSIKYRVEPDTDEEYFVRFFYERPYGASRWEVVNMHVCDDRCSASCAKRPSTGFGTARLDLHTYRMQVQAMKVDELRRMCANKQLGNKGKKDTLVKRLLDAAEQEDEAARVREQEEEAEAERQAKGAEVETEGDAATVKRKASTSSTVVSAAKRPAVASVSGAAASAASVAATPSAVPASSTSAASDDDSDDSDDDLEALRMTTKTAAQLEAEAKARREMQLKRQGVKPEGPTFEEEVAKMEQGDAAAGEASTTAIDLTSESAQIVRALYEIERASALASVALPEKPTPNSFKVDFELMQHQKQALAWMQEREASRVPLSGGILADEMGLGKTAECLSVIISDMEDHKQLSSRAGPTLIVCPTSVVDSWETEIYSRFAPAFRPKFLTYSGDAKQMPVQQLQDLDIVITTFGSLLPSGLQLRSFKTDFDASKAVKRAQHPLFGVQWRRVVLDEAHYIRNHNSESARACRLLNAERRWAVTGTPIQNGVNDLLSLFMFLQFRPLDTPKLFHAAFGGNKQRDWQTGEQKSVPVKIRKLHAVLAPVMLRRRKDSTRPDGTPIVQLPPKTISVVESKFSEEEAEFYTQLEKRMAARFKKYADAGLVYENYTNVLVMIQKLRQACNHPHLATNGRVNTPGYQEEGKSLLDSLDAAGITAVPELPPEGTSSSIPAPIEDQLERLKDALTPPFEESCPICMDMLDAASSVVCLCGHLYCKECIVEWRDILGNSPCPECRAPLDADPLTPLQNVHARVNERWPPPKVKAEQDKVKEEKAEAAATAAATPKAKLKFLESAKVAQLMKELKQMRAKDSAMKCIVFSNFTSFLDITMAAMKHSSVDFRAVRVDGSMDVKTRQKQLHIFRTDSRVSILVMSLKAGSHGLNLTCANNVILCEPWWNPMPEQQAMDRVHRTGQKKPVTVIKLTVDGTIEQRILEMQVNKWQVADSVLGEDSGMSAGAKKARKLSIQELFSLFGMAR